MQWLYAMVIGLVASSMAIVVYRFEPNRALASALVAIVYARHMGEGSLKFGPFADCRKVRDEQVADSQCCFFQPVNLPLAPHSRRRSFKSR
jgi:hypothetical protein